MDAIDLYKQRRCMETEADAKLMGGLADGHRVWSQEVFRAIDVEGYMQKRHRLMNRARNLPRKA